MASREIASGEYIPREGSGLRGEWDFFHQAATEVERASRGGTPGCLAYISLVELAQVRERVGLRGEVEVRDQIAELLLAGLRPLDLAGQDGRGRFLLLLPEAEITTAQRFLQWLARRISGREFKVRGESQRFTPRIGLASFGAGKGFDTLRLQAQQALAQAIAANDPAPVLYDPTRPVVIAPAEPRRERRQAPRWLVEAAEPLEEPLSDIADSARERWEQFQQQPLVRAWRSAMTALNPLYERGRALLASFTPSSAVEREAHPLRAALLDTRAVVMAARRTLLLLVLLAFVDRIFVLGLHFTSYLVIVPLLFAAVLVWTALRRADARNMSQAPLAAPAQTGGARNSATTNKLRQTAQPWRVFSAELASELARAERGGEPGCLAVLRLPGLMAVRNRLGEEVEGRVLTRVAEMTLAPTRPLDLLGRGEEDELVLLMPETSLHAAGQWLDEIARRLTEAEFVEAGETIRLIPDAGYAQFGTGAALSETNRQARVALEYARGRPGGQPAGYDPLMEAMSRWTEREEKEAAAAEPWAARRRTELLIAAALLLGGVIPFLLLAVFDAALTDIAPAFLAVAAVALLIELIRTAAGARAGLRPVAPAPEPPYYPEASAIVGARLPEDGPVLIATIESFLNVTYPAARLLVLAYSTDDEEAAQPILEELQARHRRMKLLRVADGKSRPALLGPALRLARGEMIALFDADYHPAADSWQHAWRRLATGVEVVQGYSPARNADVSPLAAASAVDADARFLRDNMGRQDSLLGVLRSSNSYWRADVLRETPLAAFAAGDEITAWQAPVEDGYKIAVDPKVVASELAPVHWWQLWARLRDVAQARLGIAPRDVAPLLLNTPVAPIRKYAIQYYTTWTRLFPWLAGLYPTTLLFILWRATGGGYNIPLLVLLPALVVLLAGAIQSGLAYRRASPDLRRHTRAFVLYPLAALLFLMPLANVAGQVEQIDRYVGRPRKKKTT